ncbi:MAG: hypothetical protein SFZ24_08720 [Planctomycetota bacterium]|nr:hypothetical protein [Planctomycetota bacterium]
MSTRSAPDRLSHTPARFCRATGPRRGVTGILAMIFLVMFSSLAAAMAVMSKGNLRAAETHQRICRAQAAVDTGLQIAQARLTEAASRMIVARGELDAEYAGELWAGTYPNSPAVTIIAPPDGRVEPSTPRGLAEIIELHHDADADPSPIAPITLGSAPTGWVRALPIAIERNDDGDAVSLAQLDYVPPDNQGRVLVISTGYEWDWLRDRWVTRTAQQFFSIGKYPSHAIISPSRVMIGRNVAVNGPLGIRYTSASLDTIDGSPLTSVSDFEGLDAELSAKVAAFHTRVLADDVDGDNRLRISHSIESRGLASLNQMDFDQPPDSAADRAFEDYTRDNAIDEFDIFLKHFDTNRADNAQRVVLSEALTDGTPAEGEAAEFALDDALALLIDSGVPDRNGNGRWNGNLVDGEWDWNSFPDNNGDGARNEDDIDADDITLGYRDGVLDFRDQYAKIRGSVYFRASRNQWETSRDDYGVALADYQKMVEGTIAADPGERPVKFQATDAEVPDFTPESFAEAARLMGEFASEPGVQSDDFAQVIADQVGDEFIIESTPFGSPAPADWYRRPVYRNLTFRNTTIPWGTNALFVNCTFVGVTRVRTWIENTHASWIYYGEQQRNPATGALVDKYPLSPASTIALDERWCAFLDCNGIVRQPTLMVDVNGDGSLEACSDTKLVSNNLRFHDCTFIGSIVADKPRVFTHVRNKLQFTGATRFSDRHPTEPDDPDYQLTDEERALTSRSSMMLPHYSVDVGTNNSPAAQNINLQGAVIAGVLDVRGNASITGALLLTFRPEYGVAPLAVYGAPAGNPEGFNVTLGYFTPEQGDNEGLDLSEMTDLDADGTLDVGWDSARTAAGALVAVGTTPIEESWFDGVPDTDANPATHIRRAIPFNGFGKITLNLDPNLTLPDGLAAPISIKPVLSTYLEGQIAHGN